MEQNDKLVFELMITYPQIFEKVVEQFNVWRGTDFHIKETKDDEVPFCVVEVSEIKCLIFLT